MHLTAGTSQQRSHKVIINSKISKQFWLVFLWTKRKKQPSSALLQVSAAAGVVLGELQPRIPHPGSSQEVLGGTTARAGWDPTPDAACPLRTHTALKWKAGSVRQRLYWLFTGEVFSITVIHELLTSWYEFFCLCSVLPLHDFTTIKEIITMRILANNKKWDLMGNLFSSNYSLHYKTSPRPGFNLISSVQQKQRFIQMLHCF